MTRYRVIKDDDGTVVEPIDLDGKQIQLFSVKDVASIYGVHIQTVYDALAAEKIKGHKVGWNWIFVSTELPDEWPGG